MRKIQRWEKDLLTRNFSNARSKTSASRATFAVLTKWFPRSARHLRNWVQNPKQLCLKSNDLVNIDIKFLRARPQNSDHFTVGKKLGLYVTELFRRRKTFSILEFVKVHMERDHHILQK